MGKCDGAVGGVMVVGRRGVMVQWGGCDGAVGGVMMEWGGGV